MNINIITENTDLTENEASVLVFLFENGLSTAYEISKEINIPKVSVTYLLNRLLDKGLVEKRTQQNTFYFDARSPEKLLEKHDLRIEALQKKRVKLAETVKDFQKLRNYDSKYKINYYSEKSEVHRLHSNLRENYEKGLCDREFDSETNLEYYKNDEAMFIFDLEEMIAIKLDPNSNIKKIAHLVDKIAQSELLTK